jgi:hypothetical protein
MPTFQQPKTIADILLVEVKPGWTKQRVLLKAGFIYALGAVLAVDANKKHVSLAPASEGTENTAVCVLGETINATAGDKYGVAIKRGAVVDQGELIWPAGATDAQKATALAQLDERGIVAKVTTET